MRQAAVYYQDWLAGQLTETDEGDYVFQYDSNFQENHPTCFLSFTMPVRQAAYRDKRLFAFFEGLIPEGWLLNIASANWKIPQNDRMGLLMACCHDCIGAVSIRPLPNETHEN